METVKSEKEEIEYLLSMLKHDTQRKIEEALKWARKFEIPRMTSVGRKYNSRQIATLVFLYESIEPDPSWRIGGTLCCMDTAEQNLLVPWLRETFIFKKDDIYEAFLTWMTDGSRLGFVLSYDMCKTYEIMHEAAFKGDKNLLDWLLSRNFEVDSRDSSRKTPLHIAASQGNIDTVKLLLERGASMFVLDSEKHTPFQLALEYEHFNICDILFPRINKIIESILFDIVREGNIRKLTYILSYDSDHRHIRKALLIAVEKGYPKVVETLLYHCQSLGFYQHGYNIKLLTMAFTKGDIDIIEMLLAAGFQMEKSILKLPRKNNMEEILKWFYSSTAEEILD